MEKNKTPASRGLNLAFEFEKTRAMKAMLKTLPSNIT
jgi:hypothetical protein